MSHFVSYAQNLEDVMLWRALKDVATGHYVDVGANDPVVDSVTKAFYDRGWSGLNVEPSAEHAERLRAARPRDTTVACAAGERDATATLYDFPGTGLSTLDEAIASGHAREGRGLRQETVQVKTLASLLDAHPLPALHFLKVDVEGSEAAVLRGMDFGRHRPWIVMVEATRPLTATATHETWEPLLEAAGYRFVWFDGLNRFFVAGEKAALAAAFSAPPNFFDAFVLSPGHHLCRGASGPDPGWSQARIRELEDRWSAAQRRVDEVESAWAAERARVREVEDAWNAAQRRALELAESFTHLEASLAAEKTAASASSREAAAALEARQRLERDAQQLRERLEGVFGELHTALERVRTLEEAWKAAQDETSAAQARITALEAEHAKIDRAFAAARTDWQAAQQKESAERAGLGEALAASQADAARLRQELETTVAAAAALQGVIDGMSSTRTWRMTAPLRALGSRWGKGGTR